MSSYIIPTAEEIRRRTIAKKGIQFCIMILGESGSGKSTFVNNLCNRNVFEENNIIDSEKAHINPGIEIYSRQIQMNEQNSTPISLDLVMIPGFGDNIDNSTFPKQICTYLDAQFDIVLNEEVRIKRQSKSVDTRPHACIYFIRPTSRGLRELDIALMKSLYTKVNLIPVISKADLLTESEVNFNKELIMKDILKNNIKIYDFGESTVGDVFPDDIMAQNTKLNDLLPFSIISSNDTETDENGVEFHVRRYQWGTAAVENRVYSDFSLLKNILLGSHLQELKDATHNNLYETYRTYKLSQTLSLSENNSTNDLTKSLSFTDKFKANNEIIGSSTTIDGKDRFQKELEDKDKVILEYQKQVEDLQKLLKVNVTESLT